MTEYFPDVPKIQYEGRSSKNPLAYRHYDPKEVIEGRSMEEWLRFSVCYWHTLCGNGSDPFGAPTLNRPWNEKAGTLEGDLAKANAAFEFMGKLGVPFFCLHDRDIATEQGTLRESNARLDQVVAHLKDLMSETGIRLLWGTANLFSNPRFMHGAATSPNPDVFAFAAAQVKKALEVTKELGGENYVFWGGREGYMCSYNTDMKRELDHLARFMHMAHDYAKEIGFTGQFLFEPKPKEPTKHQYDFDAAACLNFIRQYGLLDVVKLNIETNHATLAGHEMMHELEYARIQGALGSIDANRGDLLLGWDTDQFPTDIYLTTQIMLVLMKQGGLHSGGTNFDAKVRRESIDPIDLFHAHIGGMDAFARGLKIAAAIRADGALSNFVTDRYSNYDSGFGARIDGTGPLTLAECEAHVHAAEAGTGLLLNDSGRQEWLENLINQYI